MNAQTICRLTVRDFRSHMGVSDYSVHLFELTEAERRRSYQYWYKLKKGCYDPSSARYHELGALGYTMDPEWCISFENWFQDVGLHAPRARLITLSPDIRHFSSKTCYWVNEARSRRISQGKRMTGEELIHTARDRRRITKILERKLFAQLRKGHNINESIYRALYQEDV